MRCYFPGSRKMGGKYSQFRYKPRNQVNNLSRKQKNGVLFAESQGMGVKTRGPEEAGGWGYGPIKMHKSMFITLLHLQD